MIRWRNVFIALLFSVWAHGLASAILHSVGLGALGGFCIFCSIMSAVALIPVGIAANDQADSYVLKRAEGAEEEVRRLRAELVERPFKEED